MHPKQKLSFLKQISQICRFFNIDRKATDKLTDAAVAICCKETDRFAGKGSPLGLIGNIYIWIIF